MAQKEARLRQLSPRTSPLSLAMSVFQPIYIDSGSFHHPNAVTATNTMMLCTRSSYVSDGIRKGAKWNRELERASIRTTRSTS